MKLNLIANLKSYKTSSELLAWIKFFQTHLQPSLLDKLHRRLHLFVAPPAPYYYLFSSNSTPFQLLAQDVSPFPPGSYTGAINYLHLIDFQVRGSLVGHSERRRYFHETDQDVVNKLELLLDHDLTPVVCLDEHHLASQIELISPELHSRCLFAYEPTTAIGTHQPADPDQLRHPIDLIAQLTDNAPVLYGGSISPENVQDYLSLPLHGFLVGDVSLDPERLLQLIIKIINH